MKNFKMFLIIMVIIILTLFISQVCVGSGDRKSKVKNELPVVHAQTVHAETKPPEIIEPQISLEFVSLGVPNINSSFKTYMDYRAVTNKNSNQYKFIHSYGWVDELGFMRCNAETSLGINRHYYLIALGSYYGTEIGTKYRITTDTGNVFYGVLADCKANIHTNSTNQFTPVNGNVIEFLVDTRTLDKTVKVMGSANMLPHLNGSITKIEKINFIYN